METSPIRKKSFGDQQADESLFWLELHDTSLVLIDEGGGPLDTEVALSGTGSGAHAGRIPLAGVDRVWVVHEDGMTHLSLDRPQAVQQLNAHDSSMNH